MEQLLERLAERNLREPDQGFFGLGKPKKEKILCFALSDK
jgi:hypothetical protein